MGIALGLSYMLMSSVVAWRIRMYALATRPKTYLLNLGDWIEAVIAEPTTRSATDTGRHLST